MSEQVVSLGELSRLDRKPGDVFVLHSDKPLSPEAQANIRSVFAEQFGAGVKVLIVPHGLKMSLVGGVESELSRYESYLETFMRGKVEIDDIRKHEGA